MGPSSCHFARAVIPRHKTALRRSAHSTPVRLALSEGLITPETRFLDYGCGQGGDVALLEAAGIACQGWDPKHRPTPPPASADVVNLGFVVNVIESPGERRNALQRAWALTKRLLIVSARMKFETLGQVLAPFADGFLTTRGTFQKFYDHSELRDWISESIGEVPVAAGPGVFLAFRSHQERESFLASRQRRTAPRLYSRRPEVVLERHKNAFEDVVAFFGSRGRLPDVVEVERAAALYKDIPGVDALLAAIRDAIGPSPFDSLVSARRQDLLVYLALSRFDGRPPLRKLPRDLQLDLHSLFPSYESACRSADEELMKLRDRKEVEAAFAASTVGKPTGSALYVHTSAVSHLPLLLRIYEGCAKGYIGDVEGATLAKLHRIERKVSYLAYPDFDRVAHPALHSSLVVNLGELKVRYNDYSKSEDPPVLHRKELFVATDYPRRELFARLTRQEERLGLLDDTVRIGSRSHWHARLTALRLKISGHRVMREPYTDNPTAVPSSEGNV